MFERQVHFLLHTPLRTKILTLGWVSWISTFLLKKILGVINVRSQKSRSGGLNHSTNIRIHRFLPSFNKKCINHSFNFQPSFSGAKTTRPACIGLLTRGTCPLYEPFWPPTPISRSGRWMVTHRYSGMLNALFPINDPVGEVPHPRPLRCFRNYRETVMRTSVLSVVPVSVKTTHANLQCVWKPKSFSFTMKLDCKNLTNLYWLIACSYA